MFSKNLILPLASLLLYLKFVVYSVVPSNSDEWLLSLFEQDWQDL